MLLSYVPKQTSKRPLRIVDFGAGSGRLTIPLLQMGYEVCSVDISTQSLQALTQKARDAGVAKRLTTANDLDQKGSADMIVGTDILHHVDHDEYFPKLFNTLRDGGTMVFSEPNALNLAWYIYLPIFYSWSVEHGVMTGSYANLMKQLKMHHFTDRRIVGMGLLPRPFFNFSRSVLKLHDRLGDVPVLRTFAYRYMVSATKPSKRGSKKK
jgi:2-polyprenyl-3-methyl-5-hydroxy-6-metoxy-1,4-benzoquinol methylase